MGKWVKGGREKEVLFIAGSFSPFALFVLSRSVGQAGPVV